MWMSAKIPQRFRYKTTFVANNVCVCVNRVSETDASEFILIICSCCCCCCFYSSYQSIMYSIKLITFPRQVNSKWFRQECFIWRIHISSQACTWTFRERNYFDASVCYSSSEQEKKLFSVSHFVSSECVYSFTSENLW